MSCPVCPCPLSASNSTLETPSRVQQAVNGRATEPFFFFAYRTSFFFFFCDTGLAGFLLSLWLIVIIISRLSSLISHLSSNLSSFVLVCACVCFACCRCRRSLYRLFAPWWYIYRSVLCRRPDISESFAQRDDGVHPATTGVAGRHAPIREDGGSSNQGTTSRHTYYTIFSRIV